MFGMLRGVTEVVSGVTVTTFVSDKRGIMSLRPGHCLPDDNLASDWLLSLHLAGTEPHQASHWTVISRSSHSLNTLVRTQNSRTEETFMFTLWLCLWSEE